MKDANGIPEWDSDSTPAENIFEALAALTEQMQRISDHLSDLNNESGEFPLARIAFEIEETRKWLGERLDAVETAVRKHK